MRIEVYRRDQYLGGYRIGSTRDIGIGRGRKNQIILPDETVSRSHAELIRQGSRYLLLDRSTNGTWIAGERVEKALLEKGGEFTIGPYLLRLTGEEAEWDRETERKQVPSSGRTFRGIVGRSPAMEELFGKIRQFATTIKTVLIIGETGCGKELVAQAVHDLSPRASGPFVAINCGAISADLVESELFGHEKGAFTGASSPRKGAFEQADGGTLFLDEIGELSMDLQPKLLRVLEAGEIRRVGSQSTVGVDVRVVTATHRNLKLEADQGRFREDLLYRLHVLPLVVPSLRERPEDIPLLARHFLGGEVEIDKGAMRRLMRHPWPGNVRELKNVLERAAILREGARIGPGDLIFLDEGGDGGEPDFPTPHTLEELERMYYVRALEKSDGNIRAAARSLGIAKSTFYDRLRRYGLSDRNRAPGEEEDG
ncbi:MAG: sigma 54-dependent Fis family transcriptional regulator [bacterium]|nr:MAG: sigma 54-dependent Fis family transcriptional regulator [bacterium]